MTDMQSWMRKTIQPVRTRTPTPSLYPDEHRGIVDTGSLSESSTPRRRTGPRKKISSYFSHRQSKYLGDLSDDVCLSSVADHDSHSPDIRTMIDAIFNKLCNQPFDGLPAQLNSSILHVVEAYRNLNAEKEQLDRRLQEMDSRLKEGERKWASDEEDFRAEIKRLELIVARGKNGMSQLMACRQNSIINRKRRHGAETGLGIRATNEVQRNHETSNDNRRVSQMSPSRQERALSIQLSSAANNHVLVGTPPLSRRPSSLGRLPTSYDDSVQPAIQRNYETSGDEDASSASSTNAVSWGGESVPRDQVDSSAARDLQVIKQMAFTVAANRGLQFEQILPRIVSLFDGVGGTSDSEVAQMTPTGPDIHRPPSWIPGDDTAAWNDAHAGPTTRPIDSSASSQYETMSDLSASSSDSVRGQSTRRNSRSYVPTHGEGLARPHQEHRSSVVTVVASRGGHAEAETLSSSVSSRGTTVRNSVGSMDADGSSNRKRVRHLPRNGSRRAASVSVAQPRAGRFAGGSPLPLRQKTNTDDNTVSRRRTSTVKLDATLQ